MFSNNALNSLKGSLNAAEDLRKISSINIANSNTVGYKALQGVIAPDCECQCFSDVLPEVAQRLNQIGGSTYPSGNLHLEMVRDNKPGRKLKANGKVYEGSNVDPTKEFSNLVTAAAMTRSALAAIQLDNKIQSEILNLGR
jgi:flagellar basal body rod protein FlgG